MKKIIIVFLILALVYIGEALAIKPTREYTPVVKQATYTSDQTLATLWYSNDFKHIVCDSFMLSSNTENQVTLQASETIVVLTLTASTPVISPGGFLWKSINNNEAIQITTVGEYAVGTSISVTVTGWEEDN